MSEERFDRIERRLDSLETGQTELRVHMDTRFEELGRHMRILHNDAIARIATVAEYTSALSARMDARFDEVLDVIGRRLDPLEATVRQHSVEIERLKQKLG